MSKPEKTPMHPAAKLALFVGAAVLAGLAFKNKDAIARVAAPKADSAMNWLADRAVTIIDWFGAATRKKPPFTPVADQAQG
jgi:hypothetical protein